jgi:CMP-N-acetylneuraminic acid synthetase
MKIVALLPMKGHSSRVPGKNFKQFVGKPLYRWILDTLDRVESIDQIIINTDAKGQFVASGLVESNKVVFRDRDPVICGDEVSMNRVLEDDVTHLDADIYLMTHSTNPLLSRDTIEGAIAVFREGLLKGTCDSLFTVNRFQTRFYTADAKAIKHDPNNLIPTQELEPWYEENSNLYLFTKESFLSTRARIGERPMIFETPKLESSDIDTPEDWILAEYLAKFLLSN